MPRLRPVAPAAGQPPGTRSRAPRARPRLPSAFRHRTAPRRRLDVAAPLVLPAPRSAHSPVTRFLGGVEGAGPGGPCALKGTRAPSAGGGAAGSSAGREPPNRFARRMPWGGGLEGSRGAGWPAGSEGWFQGSGPRSGQSPARAGSPVPVPLPAPAALAGAARLHSFPTRELRARPPRSHGPHPSPTPIASSPPFCRLGKPRRRHPTEVTPSVRGEFDLTTLPASRGPSATTFRASARRGGGGGGLGVGSRVQREAMGGRVKCEVGSL